MPIPDDDRMEQYRLRAELCKVLTDPKRHMLLDALRAGDRSVSDLAAAIGVTLANASQHLAVLRSAGLVDSRRAGTSVRYRLAEPSIVAACDVVHDLVTRRIRDRRARTMQAPAAPSPAFPSQR
jgi:DNA-binding transcriptional ArsR family regulator